MANIGNAVDTAIDTALNAVKPLAPGAKTFLVKFLEGRAQAFIEIAEGLATGDLDESTARYLLMQEGLLISAEAAALAGLTKVALQTAVDAFLKSLTDSIKTMLKLAI